MKFSQKLKWLACTLILCTGFGGTASVSAQDLPRYEENTLYVKFKDRSEISAKKMLNGKSDSKGVQTSLLGLNDDLIKRFKIETQALSMALFDNPVLDKTFMITVESEAVNDIELLKEELERNPNVEYVERVPFNRIFSADSKRSLNDPFYGPIGEKKVNVSWHLDMIQAEKAWQIQTGDPNIVVAVIDNAIWADHEDLQIPKERQYDCYNNVMGNSNPPVNSEVQNTLCDSSDLIKSTCTAYDFSHGTHCAGAIAAINNNGVGIASIGSGVSLYAIAGPDIRWPSGIMAGYNGIDHAVRHGAKVISCSWGSADFSRTNEAMVKACYDRGIIVLAAAGNDNIDTPHYPAAYAPYVISVGSVDADRKKSNFSNHGYWVDMLAPGGFDTSNYKTMIFSTTFCQNQYSRLLGGVNYFNGTYYDEMSGTSMATPILAGIVSLMVSKDPSLTTDQVRAILQNTGNSIDELHSFYYNEYCHIADAYEALKFLTADHSYMPTIDTLAARTSHDSVWLEWKAPKTSETVTGYRVYRNGEKIAENYQGNNILDTNLVEGTTIRYAVEPIYENSGYYTSRVETDIEIKKYFNINVIIRPNDSYGTVEGAGTYEEGQMFTLTAKPNADFLFDYWLDEAGKKFSNPTLRGPALQNKSYFAFFTPSSGNEDLQMLKKAVSISPNPAKDEINIQCTDYELQHIRISDTRGRIVYNAGCIDCKTHAMNIHIGSWAKGTYVVQVTTSKGTVSHKLIKR